MAILLQLLHVMICQLVRYAIAKVLSCRFGSMTEELA